MKRVLGLMLFCFGIGMTLLLFIPETISTLIFIIACLILGYHLFWRHSAWLIVCRDKKPVEDFLIIVFHRFFYALSTRPERRQEVHTYIFFAPPLTLTLTDFTLAFQIALDLLWEWLTLLPK